MFERPPDLFLATLVKLSVLLLNAALFPFVLLIRAVHEITGEEHWYRCQCRKMIDDRLPLPDEAYLEVVAAKPVDAELWLGWRRAVAETSGVPAEAVYPDDRLDDLWRMQLVGPDYVGMMVRMESSTGLELDGNDVWFRIAKLFAAADPPHKTATFRQFGAIVVQVISGVNAVC